MSGATSDQAARLGAIEAAVIGVRAAAATARQLDYQGLAEALEELATVLVAVPAEDAHRIADALLSGAQHTLGRTTGR
jgi:hypothetical protein